MNQHGYDWKENWSVIRAASQSTYCFATATNSQNLRAIIFTSPSCNRCQWRMRRRWRFLQEPRWALLLRRSMLLELLELALQGQALRLLLALLVLSWGASS